MRSFAKVSAGLAFVLLPSLVAAQSTLGDLLDAGAKRLTVEDFKREVVQHSLIGRSAWGGAQEIMYASNGTVHGSGSSPIDTPGTYRTELPISGEWKAGEGGTICTAMRITATTGTSTTLPARCQVWFKLGDAYFVADSDTDRRATVLRRSIKSTAGPVAMPTDLGQLLDAGAKQLSAVEFKSETVQRLLVGPMADGGSVEMMYLANGTIQGRGRTGTGFQAFPYPEPTITGQWSIDQAGSVCSTLRVAGKDYPTHCEVWFKLGDAYFLADSASDRRAKVLRRTLKP